MHLSLAILILYHHKCECTESVISVTSIFMMKIKVENTKIEIGEKWPVFVGMFFSVIKTIVNDKE